jgi:hypothetical protein
MQNKEDIQKKIGEINIEELLSESNIKEAFKWLNKNLSI